jgi:hypothetical protein
MNKEQEGLIELVGQEYTKWFYDNAAPSVSGKPILNGEGILTRGEFINKCKTNPEFSEKWGLKIEERELSLEERIIIYALKEGQTYEEFVTNWNTDEQWLEDLSDTTIPTKLITITYNDTKLESYE